MRGVLLCEGPSDVPLAGLIERYMRGAGKEINISSPPLPPIKGYRGLEAKLRALRIIDKAWPDLIFLHRDIDKTSYEDRLREVEDAALAVDKELQYICIPIFPDTMTEAWVLCNEDAIRVASGNPRGRTPLGLPKPRNVHSVRDPKDALADALVDASGVQGRRLKKLRSSFGRSRSMLLEGLDYEELRDVPAWKTFCGDLDQVLAGNSIFRS